jgi:hypothetical protein
MSYSARNAAGVALRELEAGRWVVILMPDVSHFRSLGLVGDGVNLTMPRRGIFVRSATSHSSLLCAAVDTLIVVGDCEPEGVDLAKEHMLRASSSPKVILIPGPGCCVGVIEGPEIWS